MEKAKPKESGEEIEKIISSDKIEADSGFEEKDTISAEIEENRKALMERVKNNQVSIEDQKLKLFALKKIKESTLRCDPSCEEMLINIYIEYLKALESQEQKVSFSDYASMNYGYTVIGDEFVPEEEVKEGKRLR